MMGALSGMGGMPGSPPMATPGSAVGATSNPMTGNPMAAMMQDPAMMQNMMNLMGSGGTSMPGDGAMLPPPAAAPARCGCGNFESGKGDGLCNACRNTGGC